MAPTEDRVARPERRWGCLGLGEARSPVSGNTV